MILISFDKLLQYQFVEPSDVINWAFYSKHAEGLGAFEWEILKGALDKANGRVLIAKKKVALHRKEQDDALAKEIAQESAEMDVDGNLAAEKPVVQTAAMTTALSASSTLVADQRVALSKALEGFATLLGKNDDIVTPAAWERRTTWDESEWKVYETWGWYRHFCRLYAGYLTRYAKTMEACLDTKLQMLESDGAAAQRLRRYLSIAVGDADS